MTVFALTAAVVVIAAVAIAGEYRPTRTLVYVFKPLTTVLIIALAVLAGQADPTYRRLIVLGLVLSLAGDVFLMLPEKPRSYFLPGLVAFLLAQVSYIWAFSLGAPWAIADLPILLPFALFGVGCSVYFWPRLGPMKLPVVAYIVVILAMGWRSGVRLGVEGVTMTSGLCALVGAVSFIVSDLILATNRFVRPFKTARLTNLTTYWGAQLLIALSLHF